MKRKKTIFILATFVVAVSAIILCRYQLQKDDVPLSLPERAEKAKAYAEKHGLNTDFAIFVDYGIPSGTPRLFVWDFNKGKVISKTYVMHGPGGGSTAEKPVFSNKFGSNCSSLGKFKVTRAHGSKLKRSYRLKGLEASNSNALPRGLMIHSSMWVDAHRKKKYIPLHEKSCQGCITVSTAGMSYLEKLIKKEDAPLLLWSWYSED